MQLCNCKLVKRFICHTGTKTCFMLTENLVNSNRCMTNDNRSHSKFHICLQHLRPRTHICTRDNGKESRQFQLVAYSPCCWQGHADSKTLHQQNPPVLNWRCRLMQVDLYNGRKRGGWLEYITSQQ